MGRWILQLMMAVAVAAAAGCGSDGNGSPTSPTPSPPTTPAATRIIALEGDLNFGDVTVGTTATKDIRIVNRGNATLTVSGLTGPSGFAASWTNGAIAPNQWQDLTVRFSPTAHQSYGGTFTVNGDHTSGANTLAITARGVRERWSRTGVGNTVFDMPSGITRLRIIGTYAGYSENFIVYVGGRLVVNELVGTAWSQTRYDGIHLVSGTVVVIESSSRVQWSFEELR